MDACHLLFGRPWQFDLKAQHDGTRNTYSITKDGKVIELLPLMDNEEEAKVLVLGRQQFMKNMADEGIVCYALIPSPPVEKVEKSEEKKEDRLRLVEPAV